MGELTPGLTEDAIEANYPMAGMMILTKSERMELQQQVSARNGRADTARRARLILPLPDGHAWAEIRAKLDCSDSFIDLWSKRFATDRLAGLFSRHEGRERYKVTDRIEARAGAHRETPTGRRIGRRANRLWHHQAGNGVLPILAARLETGQWRVELGLPGVEFETDGRIAS